MGDQPEAIGALVSGLENGLDEQVLKGVTGSGKTFTININVTEERIPEEEREDAEFEMIGF